MPSLIEVANRFDVPVKSDSEFQRRARLLQSIWRESKGFKMAKVGNRMLGSRLSEADGAEGHNFLTCHIRDVAEYALEHKEDGQVIEPGRLRKNLLSSQPLCFNLFGELVQNQDSAPAAQIFSELVKRPISKVTRLEFEFSPGRQSQEFLNDGTAFDFYIEYFLESGGKGFLGVEVKYHENLAGKEQLKPDNQYHPIATRTGWFDPDSKNQLGSSPLVQIWRDHLLAASMLQSQELNFSEGFYAIIYPQGNKACRDAVARYQSLLVNKATFFDWTLEEVHRVFSRHIKEDWLVEFEKRYLDFSQVDALLM